MESEHDLVAIYSFPNMPNGILGTEKGVHQLLLGEFKIQGDVKMYGRLHGYDDFLVFDLSIAMELAAISKRTFLRATRSHQG